MKQNSKQELLIHRIAIAEKVFSEPKKIIFIDSQVEDYQILASGVVAGIETVILDRHSDGIEQITSVLSQNRNIDSIHIVSHGSPGCLYLGNSQLSLDTLDKYQAKLKTWFNTSIFKTSLNNQGQGILSLYGCNVAAGDAGEEFITKLNKLTEAAISASTTPIGNKARGGNWDLDFCTNSQGKNLAFTKETQANYPGVFETVTYNNNDSEATIDNGTITKTFNVTGSLIITDINIGLNLAHDYRSALDITLQHPDGTTIELTTDNGSGEDNVYVLFDDEANVNITADQETHNITGYSNLRIPEEALSAFDGKSSSGTWILTITDDDGYGDVGTYNESQLVIEGTSNATEEQTDEKFSLGNQIWLDTNNNGQIDGSESGIDGSDVVNQNFLEQVEVELISGTNFKDYLYGTANNDYIDAKEGNDFLYGSLGADVLVGGDGSDMARYRSSDTSVNVNLSNNTATGGDAEGDTFDSIENLYGSIFSDVLIGDDSNNRLYGHNGNDLIEGGAGQDRLYGGRGNDILTGASLVTNGVAEVDQLRGNWGADVFVLGTDSAAFYDDGDNTSNGIADYAIILDFNRTEDVIQLSGTETYYLDTNPAGTLFGTGVFIDNDGTDGLTPEDELVGLIRGSALTPGMIDDSTSGFVLV